MFVNILSVYPKSVNEKRDEDGFNFKWYSKFVMEYLDVKIANSSNPLIELFHFVA